MAGYIGYSMSRNAADARDRGLRPISEWSKSLILEAIHEAVEEEELVLQFDEELLRKVKLSELKRVALVCEEWHHTSKFYNRTDFYGLDICNLEDMNKDDVMRLISH